MTKHLGHLAAGISLIALVGCSGLPGEGPRAISYPTTATQHVKSDAGGVVNPEVEFILVDLTPRVVQIASADASRGFLGGFATRAPAADFPIGIGDTVRVTIFEASPGGLFIPQNQTLGQGNFVNVPDQQVLRNGMINVPYANAVQAAGRRPAEVAAEIENRLKTRAIEPQVVVTVVNRESSLVAVTGEVNKPDRISLSPRGDRILDVIAAAGGSRWPDYESVVRVQRRGRESSVRLSQITRNPANNVFVLPNDTIFVERRQRRFMAFGALGIPAFSAVSNLNIPSTQGIARSALFSFEDDTVNLAEGLAKAGGLNPDRADPYTVVLYRLENRRTLEKMGADTSAWPCAECDRIPAVYRLNMRDPSSFFLAQKFMLEDQDIIYVAPAPIEDVLVLSGVIRTIAGAVTAVRDAGRAY